MGFYDKGTYGQEGYNPDQERQSARDRYLELLTRQRDSNQAMADKMRHEQETKNKQMNEDAAGAQGVKGAQLGLSAGGPWGALIGAIIGKGVGSAEYASGRKGTGKASDFWAGLKKFHDPRGAIHALTGSNGQSGAAGASLANSVGDYREERNRGLREKALLDKAKRDNQAQPSNDYSLGGEGQKLSLDQQYQPAQGQQNYYGQYGNAAMNENYPESPYIVDDEQYKFRNG